jgi:nucleoside-diphosphate-sugar epimerase
MKRLLITGATGFLGYPCLVRASQEFEVHAIARNVPSTWHQVDWLNRSAAAENNQFSLPITPIGRDRRSQQLNQQYTNANRTPAVNNELKPGHSVRFHKCDILNAEAVSKSLASIRPTHLLHLAWIAKPGEYWTSLENHLWVDATKHLVQTFLDQGGKRVVLVGSCAEYDWSVAGVCHEFETPRRPATVYGRCKHEVGEWALSLSCSLAWARLFFLYGPGEHPARLVPSVARALLAGNVADCTSGQQQRDFLHVHDAASALIELVKSPVTGAVNLGSGEAVAVRTVIEIVARECGRPELVQFGSRPIPSGEPNLLVADVSRLRSQLDWQPQISLPEGLRDTVNWWRGRAQRVA